jgi:hypothetical protein
MSTTLLHLVMLPLLPYLTPNCSLISLSNASGQTMLPILCYADVT